MAFTIKGIFLAPSSKNAARCPSMYRTDPTTKLIRTQMSIVLKLRKPAAAAAAAAKSLQSWLTLCDPIDSSPPGSTVPGIFQARELEWVAIAFSIA